MTYALRVFRGVRALARGCVAALLATVAAAQPPPAGVQLGIDRLAADGFSILAGKRVGLVTNPTGLTGDMRPTIDVLATAPNVRLVALFGPEHGVRGDIAAGAKVEDARDPRTGLPVFSLYGKTRKPTPEMLAGVDVLVYDIQDIGSRSYTFISTLALVMEAAAEHGKAVVVLDRPNPLGGERVEGRPLDPRFTSFVGQLPIPYVHGMTTGELARMINGEGWLPVANSAAPATSAPRRQCDLTVVPLSGWTRSMLWDDTGLTWTPTSPHIPRADSAFFYAATGIFGELGVISEGVGYTLPFEVAGMPGLDAERLADELNGRRLPGVWFRPLYFRPFYGRFEKKDCGGVQVLLTDRRRVELTAIDLHIMDAVRRLRPDVRFFDGQRDAMFDKVCGSDGVRQRFIDGRPIDEILAFWREGVAEFVQRRQPYLLYP